MKELLRSFFGANYQTTISGGIRSVLAGIVTGTLTFPGDFHNVRQDALFLCVLAATFFGIQFAVQAKSKDVTGGNITQDAQGNVAIPHQAIPEPPQAAVPVSPNESLPASNNPATPNIAPK